MQHRFECRRTSSAVVAGWCFSGSRSLEEWRASCGRVGLDAARGVRNDALWANWG